MLPAEELTKSSMFRVEAVVVVVVVIVVRAVAIKSCCAGEKNDDLVPRRANERASAIVPQKQLRMRQ